MKHLLALAAIALSGLALTANSASAGSSNRQCSHTLDAPIISVSATGDRVATAPNTASAWCWRAMNPVDSGIFAADNGSHDSPGTDTNGADDE